MSATDEQHGQLTEYPHTLRPELHKALTACGIEYWVAQGITFWNRDDGCECLAYGYKANGVPKLAIKVVGFTDPEQAIEATLGGVPYSKPAMLSDLQAENSKLRELVWFANKTVDGLCEMVENSPGCFMCPLNQDEDSACGAAELFSRMCELGVEV